GSAAAYATSTSTSPQTAAPPSVAVSLPAPHPCGRGVHAAPATTRRHPWLSHPHLPTPPFFLRRHCPTFIHLSAAYVAAAAFGRRPPQSTAHSRCDQPCRHCRRHAAVATTGGGVFTARDE